MWLLLLAILIATTLCIKGLKVLNYIDKVASIMEMIPGPTPYPFVGNIFQFGLKPDEYPKKILQYCRKYDFQGFRSLVFFQYHVMLSDPAEIKNILSSSALLYKEHLYSFLKPWLGDGLLTSSGARWLKHQKIYLPAFERAAIDGYLHAANKNCNKFIEKLKLLAEDELYFDMQEYVQKLSLDIICENATGFTGNSLEDKPSELQNAVQDLCDVIQERTFSIVKRYDTLFQLTPQYWKQRKALQVLKREINRIADRRRELLANKHEQAKDNMETQPFIDLLLKAKLDGMPLKPRDIFEELSTFIFVGHEPVASAIAFTLYTLSRHVKVQEKAYEEQERIFNSTAQSDDNFDLRSVHADYKHLEQMDYLEQVIRETLRLYPSVPLIARTNRKAIDINGTKIAKRTTVIMCLIAMGYNEKYFDEPCVFRPERFADPKSVYNDMSNSGIEAFKSIPFSAGPRKCIADRYALLQLKLIISKVIRNFEISPPREGLRSGINDHSVTDCVPQSDYDPILNIRVTLKSENGILLRLRHRD